MEVWGGGGVKCRGIYSPKKVVSFLAYLLPTCIWKYGGGGGHMMECVIDRQHQMLATTLHQGIIIPITNTTIIMISAITYTTITTMIHITFIIIKGI